MLGDAILVVERVTMSAKVLQARTTRPVDKPWSSGQRDDCPAAVGALLYPRLSNPPLGDFAVSSATFFRAAARWLSADSRVQPLLL
jgi:hypothetical protein